MITKEEMAENLFRTLTVGINVGIDDGFFDSISNDDSLDETIRESAKNIKVGLINNGYTDFRKTLHLITELCTPADTSVKRRLLGHAYAWLGAKYRLLAIKYLHEYLYNDLKIDDGNWFPIYIDGQLFYENKQEAHECDISLGELSKAYEGEYMFNEALETLEIQSKLFPDNCPAIIHKCEIYRKMNNLDMAILVLKENLKKNCFKPKPYYDVVRETTTYIDCGEKTLKIWLEKYIKLKERGYVYRPRKRKVK